MLAQAKNKVEQWLHTRLFIEKLNNPLGYLLVFLLGFALSLVVAFGGLKISAGLVILLIGIPVVFGAMFNHYFGISLMLTIGFMVNFLGKFIDAPIGTTMDGLLFVMLFGLLVQQSQKKDFSFAKSQISIWVMIWILYNLFQGLNPWAISKMAWIYTVRTMALLIFVYFIACNALNSLSRIKWMIGLILSLLFFSALYGLKQEYFGFSATENAWIYADELRFQLLFQWTRMRIFSVTNDPTTFGIMMAYGGVMSLILATAPLVKWKRILLVIFGATMFLTMAYTGTRTAYVLVPAGAFFFTIMTLTRKVLITATIFFLFGTAFVMKSTSNPLVFRIQSAFHLTEDESMQVRFENQKLIQPFIHEHPIGAGLGSTGVWGKRFTPDSWLADFPHDSGFVRIAVEQGYIGLILYMILLFVVLRTALYYYVRVSDPIIKKL